MRFFRNRAPRYELLEHVHRWKQTAACASLFWGSRRSVAASLITRSFTPSIGEHCRPTASTDTPDWLARCGGSQIPLEVHRHSTVIACRCEIENRPPLKMDPRSIFTRWKWTPRSIFARWKWTPPCVKWIPRSIFRRWKWTPGPFSLVENGPLLHFHPLKMDPPLGKLGILQTLPPVPFTMQNGPPVHFHPLKMDPPVNFSSLKMDPPRKVRNIVNVTPGHREPSRSSKK